MTVLLSIALSLLAQAQEMVTIKVTEGREMSGLRDQEIDMRGTCDGQAASATITLARQDQPGRLVLRIGQWVREVPPTFLEGSLVINGITYTGLACDGRRLQLSATAIRGEDGEILLIRQNAVLDTHTGALTLTELTRLSPEETRAELTEGREATIDASGRLIFPSSPRNP